MSGARPGRRFPVNLVGAFTPTVAAIGVVIPSAELFIFPPRLGLYPLKQWDQIELYVSLPLFPTGATFVNIGLVGFEGLINTATFPDTQLPGTIYPAGVSFEVYEEQFLQLDTTNGFEVPFYADIHYTTTDKVVSMTQGPQNYAIRRRFSFPIEEDYIGFLVQQDGDNNTGVLSLWAVLGSE